MELYAVRPVFGFPEILWSWRQYIRKRRSRAWTRATGTVEGYELLLARDNGWLVVFYSYEFAGKQYSGEWRKWLLFTFSSQEEQTGKVTERLPRGAPVTVLLDPQKPSESAIET
jgi:hypothetical protein